MHTDADKPVVSEASSGTSMVRSELRSLLSGVNLAVLLIAFAAAAWGAFDSMTDARENRAWGNLPIVAPSVYAAWCMLEPAWRKSSTAGIIGRLWSACFVAPGLVAVPVGLVLAVAVIFPAVRDSITNAADANGGFHYYWSEGIAAQLFLVPLSGWMIGACVALGVCLVIALPILSLRSPSDMAAESHIEKVDGPKRDSTTAFVFCGLGATVLGIALWTFGGGGDIREFPAAFARFANTLSYGVIQWDESAWLLGVVFVVLGVGAMAVGCVRVLSARSAAARQ